MKKVIQVWYDTEQITAHPYRTGLVLELEDGTMLYQNSTDAVQPFSEDNRPGVVGADGETK